MQLWNCDSHCPESSCPVSTFCFSQLSSKSQVGLSCSLAQGFPYTCGVPICCTSPDPCNKHTVISTTYPVNKGTLPQTFSPWQIGDGTANNCCNEYLCCLPYNHCEPIATDCTINKKVLHHTSSQWWIGHSSVTNQCCNEYPCYSNDHEDHVRKYCCFQMPVCNWKASDGCHLHIPYYECKITKCDPALSIDDCINHSLFLMENIPISYFIPENFLPACLIHKPLCAFIDEYKDCGYPIKCIYDMFKTRENERLKNLEDCREERLHIINCEKSPTTSLDNDCCKPKDICCDENGSSLCSSQSSASSCNTPDFCNISRCDLIDLCCRRSCTKFTTPRCIEANDPFDPEYKCSFDRELRKIDKLYSKLKCIMADECGNKEEQKQLADELHCKIFKLTQKKERWLRNAKRYCRHRRALAKSDLDAENLRKDNNFIYDYRRCKEKKLRKIPSNCREYVNPVCNKNRTLLELMEVEKQIKRELCKKNWNKKRMKEIEKCLEECNVKPSECCSTLPQCKKRPPVVRSGCSNNQNLQDLVTKLKILRNEHKRKFIRDRFNQLQSAYCEWKSMLKDYLELAKNISTCSRNVSVERHRKNVIEDTIKKDLRHMKNISRNLASEK